MCGIFGSPRLTPAIRNMLPYIGIAMESRGEDSWGGAGSDDGELIKHSGKLTNSWHESLDDISEWDGGIFHTRGASGGGAQRSLAANAHPFTSVKPDGTTVVGIHNGVIQNSRALNTKYKREFEVDSQHIWEHRAAGHSWKELTGWANLAWWETDEHGRCIHLARFNTSALEVAQLESNDIIFCSLQAPVEIIARMMGNPVKTWYKIDEAQHYRLGLERQDDTDGPYRLWRTAEKFPWGVVEATQQSYTPQTGGREGCGYIPGTNNRGTHNWRGPNVRTVDGGIQVYTPPWSIGDKAANHEVCIRCNDALCNEAGEVLCTMCLRTLLTDCGTPAGGQMGMVAL